MSDCKEDYVAGSDVEEVVLPPEMDSKLNNINEQAKSEGEHCQNLILFSKYSEI